LLGSIIQTAINMAAYAATARVTRSAARLLSSNFRRIVKSTYETVARSEFINDTAKQVVLGILHEDNIDTAQRFIRKTIDYGKSRIEANSSPYMRKVLGTTKEVVKNELTFLPANYLFYRMAKYNAVTPEEKTATQSFTSYYVGLPMAVSMASGYAIARINIGKAAQKMLVRTLQKHDPDRVVKGIAAGASAMSMVMDKTISSARTAKRMYNLYGIGSLISFGSSGAYLKEARNIYKNELESLAFEDNLFTKRQKELRSLYGQIEKYYETNMPDYKERNDYKLIIDTHKQNIKDLLLKNYGREMRKETLFQKLMNNIAKELNEPRYKTRKIIDREYGLPINYGHYRVGDTEVNFGRMNLSFFRDRLIECFQKPIPKFFISLFGQKDMIQYFHSENALSISFTKSHSGSVFIGKTYLNKENDVKKLIKTMIGDPRLNERETSELYDAFYKHQIETITSRYPQYKENIDRAEDLLLKHYRHGSIPVKHGDIIVHGPGGSLQLISNYLNETKDPVPFMVTLGKLDNNEFMTFYKFTREKTAATSAMRKHLGYSINKIDRNHPYIGPTPVGKVITPNIEGKRTIRDRFQIGYAEPSVINKISFIFSKKMDPRYVSTLFSQEYLQNEEFQNQIASSITEQAILTKLLKKESSGFIENFVTNISRGTGNDKRFIKEIRKLNIGIGETNAAEFLISKDLSMQEAYTKINKFEQLLFRLSDELSLVKHQIYDEINQVRNIKEIFAISEKTETVGERIRQIFSEKKTDIGALRIPGEVNKVDEYNSIVLKVFTGISGIERKVYNVGEVINEESIPTITQVQNNVEKLIKYIKSKSGVLPKYIQDRAIAGSLMSNMEYRIINSIGKRGIDILDSENIATNKIEIKEILKHFSDPNSIEFQNIRGAYKSIFEELTLLPDDFDPRPKVEAPSFYDEIFAIPKTSDGIISRRRYNINNEMVSIAHGITSSGNVATMTLINSFNKVSSLIPALALDPYRNPTPGIYVKNLVTKRILPAIGLYTGLNAVDRLLDEYAEGTPLQNGLFSFGASAIASMRLTAASIGDNTGLTNLAQYLEDLMPGSIESPLSGLARFVTPVGFGFYLGAKSGSTTTSLKGGLIGLSIGMLLAGGPLGMFGQWNIDKSRREIVDILTGKQEVPIRKGRWWELGKSSFSGGKIEYFRPHMYALMTADYKETPDFKSSLLYEAAGVLAPDIYAMKDYYSRPYPVTSGLFANIPVIGSALRIIPFANNMLLGGITMHDDDWSAYYYSGKSSQNNIDITQLSDSFASSENIYSTINPIYADKASIMKYAPFEYAINKGSFEYAFGETMNNIQDIAGMRGFLADSIYGSLTGKQSFYEDAPVLSDPSEISSLQREYWDLSLGGVLGLSEAIRRFIPHKRNEMEVFNPITNAMPSWLPNMSYIYDFLHGDPYTAIPMGEARLPGRGYETVHDVDLSMPIEADILQQDKESQIAYYLGFPEYMAPRNKNMEIAKLVAKNIRAKAQELGNILKEESIVYNPRLDIKASVDAIINTGSTITPIKVMPKDYGGESALNAFLVMSGYKSGLLIEVDPENGHTSSKVIASDIKRFTNDVQRTEISRMEAYKAIGALDRSGKAMNLGNAYSWFNRYKILADVAPYSQECKDADAIVRSQISAGYLSPTQIQEYYTIQQQNKERLKQYDFQEYRFLSIGDHLTRKAKEREKEILSKYNIVERYIGAAWEYASHLETPIHSKLLHNRTSLQEYESNVIYGKAMPMWDNPYEDFIKSYSYNMFNIDDPIQSGISFALGSQVINALLGANFYIKGAALMGATVGITNDIIDNPVVPDRVETRRDIEMQTDIIKNIKNNLLYIQTGDTQYLKDGTRTISSIAFTDKIFSPSKLVKVISGPERHYIRDVIENVTRDDFERVKEILPQYALPALYKSVGMEDMAQIEAEKLRKQIQQQEIPDISSAIYNANVPIEIPAIRTYEEEGLNAHDAGLGWYNQMATMNRLQKMRLYNNEIVYSNLLEPSRTFDELNKGFTIHSKIRKALSNITNNVNIIDDKSDTITIYLNMV